MSPRPFPDSFAPDDGPVTTGPRGQRAHRDLVDHTARLERRLWEVRPGVWCLVGNGLSNQTFVEGPDGLIAIDTGESIEEMAAALAEVRAATSAPVVAVIYTHFHYVAGTAAIPAEEGRPPATPLEVWGHERVVANRERYGLEISAAAGRGLVHQFGIALPPDGPDAVTNVGLGLFFRDPAHAPFTEGFLAPTRTVDRPTTTEIAGLTVELTPAPSDADDNLTIWFPDLGVCVDNLVWPALFNVFAIRGEEYRDPRVLLAGLDHIDGLGADHLVGSHGPPLSGRDVISREVVDYRDSIQYLWDQTVRGINQGLTMDELTERVQLPERFARSYLTRQFYGLVEHHVRQIHVGLRGWFDGDEASLFPTPHRERHRRLVEGFGGPDAVRAGAEAALADGDVRWALELASWLVRSDVDDAGRVDGGTPRDRELLASVLRTIAQRTTSSNARNWCLTRALELEGAIDVARHRVHRFARGTVRSNPLASSVAALRVVLDPRSSADVETEVAWELADGQRAGLRIRRGVAVPTDGSAADHTIALDLDAWADILSGRTTLSEAVDGGRVTTDARDAVVAFFACFDLAGLR
jgi:alkyl sulfatase BDS1-like metallo-beta-lactamase superfamily hydrolase